VPRSKDAVSYVRDDRIDLRVAGIEPFERSVRPISRRDFASTNEVSKFSRGQMP
jgi:hypothetical protein